MSGYFHEIYFQLLAGLVLGYVLVWLFAWFLALPFWGIISRGGNPYPTVYNCWKWPFILHTIFVLAFLGFTIYDLSGAGRGNKPIIIYSIGYSVLFFFNLIMIARFNTWQRKIKCIA